MTLSFHEIGPRWPDAVVYWDRDVAPTLDWEPRFVERDGVLWAVCDADAAPVPSPDVRLECYRNCRCRVWTTGGQWWTHEKWNTYLAVVQLKADLDSGFMYLPRGEYWLDENGRINQQRSDMADAIAYAAEHVWRQGLPRHRRWPTLRRVLGRNQPR